MRRIIFLTMALLATTAATAQYEQIFGRQGCKPEYNEVYYPPAFEKHPFLTWNKFKFNWEDAKSVCMYAKGIGGAWDIGVNIGDTITAKTYIDYDPGPHKTNPLPMSDIFGDFYKVEFWYGPHASGESYALRYLATDSLPVTQQLIDWGIVSTNQGKTNYNVILYAFVFKTEMQYNWGGMYLEDNQIKFMKYWNLTVRLYFTDKKNDIEEVKTKLHYSRSGNTLYFNELINNFALYNLNGNVVYQTKNVNEVNLPDVSKGVYIIKANDKIFKLII